MQLPATEQELMRASADTLYFNTFRKRTVTLILTDRRLIVGRLLGSDEYALDDVLSVQRFKAMFMNIGLKFTLANGKTLSFATMRVKDFIEKLEMLGKITGE